MDAFIYILTNEEYVAIRKVFDEGLRENQAAVSQQISDYELNDKMQLNDIESNNLSVKELEERIIDDENIENLPRKGFENFANKLIEEFEDSDNFIRIFKENLGNLVIFIIKVLQDADNVNLRRFL